MARVEEADGLYGLPLDGFVDARTALARRLRKDGRREEAAEVGGLRKPTVALWAVDQLPRRHRDEVEALLAAAERLRAGDDAADDDLRRAVAKLVDAAKAVLVEAGHAASDATLQRVATTLRAAAAGDEDERAALARGALDRELEPTGFEAMAAFAAASSPTSEQPSGGSTGSSRSRRAEAAAGRRRERVEAVERTLAGARARERELRAEAEEAELAAERARRAAERAAADVEAAEQALGRAGR